MLKPEPLRLLMIGRSGNRWRGDFLLYAQLLLERNSIGNQYSQFAKFYYPA